MKRDPNAGLAHVLAGTTRRAEHFADWVLAGVVIFGREQLPTLDEIGRMARFIAARTTLRQARGNVKRAAKVLRTSRRTINRAIEGLSGMFPLWDTSSTMSGPFDDALFPLIRVRWTPDPSPEFLEEYREWLLDVVYPRAAAEETKLVFCEDFGALGAIPPLSFFVTLSEAIGDLAEVSKPYVLGTIIFTPGVSLMGVLAGPINVAPVPVTVATSANEVVARATELFTAAGIPVPDNISV